MNKKERDQIESNWLRTLRRRMQFSHTVTDRKDAGLPIEIGGDHLVLYHAFVRPGEEWPVIKNTWWRTSKEADDHSGWHTWWTKESDDE